ncbi:MAG: hypothetical protein LBC56_08545 [Oscillospiraceae bacterium]|nr:hypothetical protein [Oscillospiraceae bacterium]
MKEDYFVYPLAAGGQLLAIAAAAEAGEYYSRRRIAPDKAMAAAENAAICAYSLRDSRGENAFRNIWEVFDKLTLEEIAGYAAEYREISEEGWEVGFNSAAGGKNS